MHVHYIRRIASLSAVSLTRMLLHWRFRAPHCIDSCALCSSWLQVRVACWHGVLPGSLHLRSSHTVSWFCNPIVRRCTGTAVCWGARDASLCYFTSQLRLREWLPFHIEAHRWQCACSRGTQFAERAGGIPRCTFGARSLNSTALVACAFWAFCLCFPCRGLVF